MPPDMAVSMRHTKLKPEEAALLAGEISKPSWESRNEGIHERVSFEDSIWGFDLAGGSFYKTPLRVTAVKPGSRAEKAGIRPGDKLLRINDIDTSTLTIQEAHELIIESGIHLKISVTSPDDEEDAYYCYEDPLANGYDSDEERRLEAERARKRIVHAKVSSYWSLQWPWVSKKRLIYRESNCFMVNSKYEEARREKYPLQPVLRYTDDVTMYQKDGDKIENKDVAPAEGELEKNTEKSEEQKVTNGDTETDASLTDDEQSSHKSEVERPKDRDSSISPISEEITEEELEQRILANDSDKPSEVKNNIKSDERPNDRDSSISLISEETNEEGLEQMESNDDIGKPEINSNMNGETSNDELSEALSPLPETLEDVSIREEDQDTEEVITEASNDDDVINEVLGKNNDNVTKDDEDNILDSILSDEGQNLESSEDNNER